MPNEEHQLRAAWGERIRAAREDRGWSMQELAERAEINQGNLSRIENGKVGMGEGMRVRIAKALGIDPDTLADQEVAAP